MSAQIAIEGGKLAIFASPMGFAGKVIQPYTPFDDEIKAIADARELLVSRGLDYEPEICRPRITSMRITYTKRRRK